MSGLLLNTGSDSFLSLIGNGKTYRVPPFQRDYSWDEEQWDDLWNDILDLPSEKKHYMGYVVFQQIDENGKIFSLIDGQQRFTTLSIFCLAATKLLDIWINEGFDADNNVRRKEQLHQRFIGNFSASKLTTTSKLFLNENNNSFYQSYIINLRDVQNISKLKPAEKRLYNAFTFFLNKLKEMFPVPNGEKLAEFIEEKVADNLFFTSITVSDDLNAFKVFETLNARGVKLSPADLIKNYLFSIVVIDKTDFEEAERRWQRINDILNKLDIATYVRHFWNSKFELVRSSNLFRELKKNITDSNSAFKLLDDLEQSANTYASLENPAANIWDKEQGKFIKYLNIFNVSQCYSVLLSAVNKFSTEELTKLLNELVVLTFRYNVISGFNPNKLETIMNQTAIKISNNEITKASETFSIFKSVYVDDETFKQAFSKKEIRANRAKTLVRYILTELENHLSSSDYSIEDSSFSIEHILPNNPGNIWYNSFDNNIIDEYENRLGNFTLLNESINNKLDNNLSFNEKAEYYKSSKYTLTNKHLNYTDWNPTTLQERQSKMANWACGIWKSRYIKK